MFLEINDKKGLNAVLYSRNIFDADENFRVIFNESGQFKHKKINYNDVFNFINYPEEKSLIVYRLLTNYTSINAADSKLGFILTIDRKDELIYTDPVFAIKDLPNMIKDFDLQSFRFKIQQIGIKTFSFKDEREIFTQLYSYDLNAQEAQSQNDKIFADALFPEDIPTENGSIEDAPAENKKERSLRDLNPEDKTGSQPDKGDKEEKFKVVQDLREEESILIKPSVPDTPKIMANKTEQRELLKKALGIEEYLGESLPDLKIDLPDEEISSSDIYSNLFKSASKKENITEREKDSITLKLTR